jgi:hypothetical protein
MPNPDQGAAGPALSILRDRYADFGSTLACEKLRECHGIRLVKETVRKLMTDAGLWIPAPATSAEAQPRCITIGIANLYSSMPAAASTPQRAVRLTT